MRQQDRRGCRTRERHRAICLLMNGRTVASERGRGYRGQATAGDRQSPRAAVGAGGMRRRIVSACVVFTGTVMLTGCGGYYETATGGLRRWL